MNKPARPGLSLVKMANGAGSGEGVVLAPLLWKLGKGGGKVRGSGEGCLLQPRGGPAFWLHSGN